MKEDALPGGAPLVQTAIVVAAILLAMLVVAGDGALRLGGVPFGAAALGIAGLLFTATALAAFDRPRGATVEAEAAGDARQTRWLVEGGLWAMAVAFALRLAELAG